MMCIAVAEGLQMSAFSYPSPTYTSTIIVRTCSIALSVTAVHNTAIDLHGVNDVDNSQTASGGKMPKHSPLHITPTMSFQCHLTSLLNVLE